MATSLAVHIQFAALKVVREKDLDKLCEDPKQLQLYLFKNGFLGDFSGPCNTCGAGRFNIIKEGERFRWRCSRRQCRVNFTLRRGSFFERSKLSEVQVFKLVYYWCYNIPLEYVSFQLEISETSLVDWFNFCRDVCADILLSDNKKIGGPGHMVEIDESKFGKNKYGYGRSVEGVWVLGGIDRETRETFFQVVKDRKEETLLPILLDNILPDTIIISDQWKSYSKLYKHFSQHLTVNHSVEFVDPSDPRVHTNNIESQWRVLKRSVLPRNGTSKSLYQNSFATFCIKRRYFSHTLRV